MIHFDKSTIVCVPKCGSTSIRAYFRNTSGLIISDRGNEHDWPLPLPKAPPATWPLPQDGGRGIEIPTDNYVFGFVRHPVDWYESFWRYRRSQRFKSLGIWPLDYLVEKPFEDFVLEITRRHPGYLGNLYRIMLWRADEIGRLEYLNWELPTFCLRAKIPIDVDHMITSLARENHNISTNPRPAQLSQTARNQLLDSESLAFKCWNHCELPVGLT